MIPERAEQMLKDYKPYVGRCNHLASVISLLERLEQQKVTEHKADLISGSRHAEEGMPHGTTVGNPTERIALMLASEHITEDIAALREAIKRMQNEYEEKSITITLVQGWLTGLTEKEKWMIERYYFDEETYREVNVRYREQYGENCSKDLLRRIKRDALEKIFAFAN